MRYSSQSTISQRIAAGSRLPAAIRQDVRQLAETWSLAIIYPPPSSSLTVFYDELSDLLTHVGADIDVDRFIACGDVNSVVSGQSRRIPPLLLPPAITSTATYAWFPAFRCHCAGAVMPLPFCRCRSQFVSTAIRGVSKDTRTNTVL